MNKQCKEKYQNINKHLVRCLGSLVIREMQIKTKIRGHLTLNTLVSIKMLDTAKDWQKHESNLAVKACQPFSCCKTFQVGILHSSLCSPNP